MNVAVKRLKRSEALAAGKGKAPGYDLLDVPLEDRLSLAQKLAFFPKEEQTQWLEETFTREELEYLEYNWEFWARPLWQGDSFEREWDLWHGQYPPYVDWMKAKSLEGVPWRTWLFLAGRGSGKTRTGAEFVRKAVDDWGYKSIALIGPVASDVRQTMVEGPSGIMSVYPEHSRPIYLPSRTKIIWRNPDGSTKAVGHTYSADSADRFRGPNTDLVWFDEVGSFQSREIYDQVILANRRPPKPVRLITTTPRTTDLMLDIINDPRTVITIGSTFDNVTNLAKEYIEEIFDKYVGTRRGWQELYAKLLLDTPNAMWTMDVIENNRVMHHPPLEKVVIAVDPPSRGAECGIIVAGRSYGEKSHHKHFYVLKDVSLVGSPHTWARKVLDEYYQYGTDAEIVVETNHGGNMVIDTIMNAKRHSEPEPIIRDVQATKGKILRAEPISGLYEQKRGHHVGEFVELEDEMVSYQAGDKESPNRLDALVWAATHLFFSDEKRRYAKSDFIPMTARYRGGSGIRHGF